MGEPSERTSVDIEAVTKREIERWLVRPTEDDADDQEEDEAF